MRGLVALKIGLIVALMSPPVFADSFTDKAKSDSTVEISDEDPAMQKAMARARAGLEGFLKKAGSPPRWCRRREPW